MLIKSKENKRIFGGYTDIAWTNNGNFKKGNGNSFIFSLDDLSFVKLKCLKKDVEVCHNSSVLRFGNNNLAISGDCYLDRNSISFLGNCNHYETKFLNYEDNYIYLAGEQNFEVVEFEVY